MASIDNLGCVAGNWHIRRLGPLDVDHVLDAGHLFDDNPREEWAQRFLHEPTHHLLIATLDDTAVGFVTGVEITHPDKGTEMLLYELGVQQAFRRRGIGRALVQSLLNLATERGCRGMWVPVEDTDEIAIATYRSAGAEPPESAAILEWKIR